MSEYEDYERASFNEPLLSELLDQIFVITGVEFFKANLGDYALVTLGDTRVYRTSSKVLLDQLQGISQKLISGTKGVRVKLIQIKRYMTFESPTVT
jgi:hypothetical protein